MEYVDSRLTIRNLFRIRPWRRVCKFFDEDISLCSIYENRPIKCDVDALFEIYFSQEMTKKEYYELNYKACHGLRKNSKT